MDWLSSFERPHGLLIVWGHVAPAKRAAFLAEQWDGLDGVRRARRYEDFARLFREVGFIGTKKPTSAVRLYRGVTRERDRRGLSWTESIDVARYFAYEDRAGAAGPTGYVYQVVAQPEAVLARFAAEREEHEYVLDPAVYGRVRCVEQKPRS